MQNKNTFKEELEKKQKSFLLIGMLVSLGLSLMAFEWASFDLQKIHVDNLEVEDLDTEPALTMIEIEKPKPKEVTRVKAREFDPEIDKDPKIVPDTDTKVVENPNAIIDSTAVDTDPIVDLDPGTVEIEEIFKIVEKMPEFPGGEKALYKYLGNSIRYTQCGKESRVQGKVYVQFVVEKDGSISDITVPRGLSCGLNEVASKAVEKMPRWSPGEQRGKKVRVKYTLPIQFKLR